MNRIDKIREAFTTLYKEQIGEDSEPKKVIDYIFDQLLQVKFTELIFAKINVLMIVLLIKFVQFLLKLDYFHLLMVLRSLLVAEHKH